MVEELAEIKRIIRYRVLSIPEVTSVSYIKKERRLVITVESAEAVPGVRKLIPEIIGGYEVVIEIMSRPEAFWFRKAKWRPIPGGVSIGHEHISAGTNASRVYDADGNRILLSNAHVFTPIAFNGRWGSVGDTISQPGVADLGLLPLEKAAELSKWVELTKKGPNFVDAAVVAPIVEITDSILGEEPEEWVVTEPVKADEDLRVKKAGRTTDVSHGIITSTDMDVKIGYGAAGDFTLDGQVRIVDERGDDYALVSPGDSGSLLVTEDTEKAVGLLYAGSTSAPYSAVACPIGYVMHLLKIGFSYPHHAPPEVPPVPPPPPWWSRYGPWLTVGMTAVVSMVFLKPELEERGLI